ncbi:MAG: DUF1846 domain-containing protein [Candidatus Lokiarchaeota archaeon]|nr:DUF1846 domain-containing protein [Candidatus Lokiarchaeota archaeon]
MTITKIGFDNKKYLKEQSKSIIDRAAQFGNKLYLEFGGKLIYDFHAARVLPGFDPNVKLKLLERLKDKIEVIICIYSGDIERRKIRADFGITYDTNTMKLIDDLRDGDINVCAVVVTRFNGQPIVKQFMTKLERRDIKVFTHQTIKGYPTNLDLIVSEEGYGANPYIETVKPIVIVTAPGPGSGKLATCLNQVYHEHKRGLRAGYAKFETFPIWNLPLKHPINMAYESATADLGDFNQVDPFHLDAYNKIAINYNRDVDAFPVVRKIMIKIMNHGELYKSPTDMGVNRAGFAITNDELVQEAAKQEMIRRFFRYSCEYAMGVAEKQTVQRAELLMKELNLSSIDRKVVGYARKASIEAQEKGKGNEGIFAGAALELKDGTIITGKNSPIMHAASALILNSIKTLAGIPDNILLLSPNILSSISKMKSEFYDKKKLSLNLEETLIALSISADFNPSAKVAMEKLSELKGCDMHSTHIPTPGDEEGLRVLGLYITSDPNFSSKSLFIT